MKQKYFFIALFLIILIVEFGCQKEVNEKLSTPITVNSLSGTYGLTALTWTYGGSAHNIYDSLDACEKDNLVKLNTDLTINYIDAGIAYVPPENDIGIWSLVGDSLYFDTQSSKIQSFDGTILVLMGSPNAGISATTTLTRK